MKQEPDFDRVVESIRLTKEHSYHHHGERDLPVLLSFGWEPNDEISVSIDVADFYESVLMVWATLEPPVEVPDMVTVALRLTNVLVNHRHDGPPIDNTDAMPEGPPSSVRIAVEQYTMHLDEPIIPAELEGRSLAEDFTLNPASKVHEIIAGYFITADSWSCVAQPYSITEGGGLGWGEPQLMQDTDGVPTADPIVTTIQSILKGVPL